MPEQASKDSLRAAVSAARDALPAQRWQLEDELRTRHVLAFAEALTPGTVAVYLSRRGEPETRGIIDGLLALNWRVLVPKLTRSPNWALFESWDTLIPGWGGIPHPSGPALGPSALHDATLILVPCLAVGRDGSRLGTGGGWYDKVLHHRRPSAPVIALARAAEVIDAVPTLPHDVPMDGFASEHGWELLRR